MPVFAEIHDGVVVNLIEAEHIDALPGLIDAADAQIGDIWDGERFNSAPPAPPIVPRAVSMRQARRALLDAGILAAVEASIAGMPGDEGQRARIDWEYATEVDRDWPLIAYMAEQLGLAGEQVDALFASAARI